MKPKTPKSIENGHENLCRELKEIIEIGGTIGEKAKALEEIMLQHFKKEEKYAFPPLGLLLTISEGNWSIDEDEAIKMSEKLQSKLSELKAEHINISKALHQLQLEADKESNKKVHQFVKDLAIHVEIEDQVLYPATILIGNYLKTFR